MGVLSDWQIREYALDFENKGLPAPIVRPYVAGQVRIVNDNEPFPHSRSVVSYGTSSYGYDFRVDTAFKVFKTTYMPIIDPKAFSEAAFDNVEVAPGEAVIIPPNSFALAVTMETFCIPRGCIGVVLGKSTYARCGLILNVTPLEPEWVGRITLEISNTTPLPAKVYAGEGVGQVLFLRGDSECFTSYADRAGKYQNATGIALPKV